PEHVINFFLFVAEELRQIMASLGFRTIAEMTGRTKCIVQRKNLDHPKANLLDFSDVLHPIVVRDAMPSSADHALRPGASDDDLLEGARISIKHREPSTVQVTLVNSDRAFGARLAGELARRHGAEGLPDGTISIEATGTAGQSFGAFAVRGMLIVLEGEANDYVGKGLSGGVLAIRPPARALFRADANVIIGNTVLYGATSGMAFFAGRAGERFAVRNSGARAVVEGVGDHGCEYMTGGVVVVLGTTGRNFGAGMSGGIAYVLDEDGRFASRCNPSMVELEPVALGDDAELRALVEAHLAHTRSEKAASLLSAWEETSCARFVKVVPTEFKKIMAAEGRKLRVISNG
ncbi:MAG: glutamate synthase subunit alpha, partial [Polyangiaceae bacterium]